MRRVAIGLTLVLALIAGWVFIQLQPPKPARTVADDFILTDVTVIEPTLSRETEVSLRVVNGRAAGNRRWRVPGPSDRKLWTVCRGR